MLYNYSYSFCAATLLGLHCQVVRSYNCRTSQDALQMYSHTPRSRSFIAKLSSHQLATLAQRSCQYIDLPALKPCTGLTGRKCGRHPGQNGGRV